MSPAVKQLGWEKKGALSAVGGLVVGLLFLLLERSFPIAIVVGVRPLLIAIALGMALALISIAAMAPEDSRTVNPSTPMSTALRLVAWWCGVALALALVAFASWKAWDIVFLFASAAAIMKALDVFSVVKRGYEFHLWLPFATIGGCLVAVVLVVLFLLRPNLPPPIEAALRMYRTDPIAHGPASRPAPDLSGAGLSLEFKGDLNLGGLPVSFFSYATQDGRRVDLYLADISFPAPLDSEKTSDPPGWQAWQRGLVLRAGNTPAHFLVVGASKETVDAAAYAYSFAPAP